MAPKQERRTIPDDRATAAEPAAGMHRAASGSKPAPRNSEASLRRAIGLVDILARETNDSPVGLGALSKSLGVHKSTVLRLLSPLVDAGLVQRIGTEYGLGPTTIRWGQAYVGRLNLRAMAAPTLAKLADATDETVHLVTYDPPEIVYIEKIDSPRVVRMHSRIGDRQPIHCTAVGKAFLATFPSDSVPDLVRQPLTKRTARTITDLSSLGKDLDKVRRRGFAVDDQENEPDIRCVAAVVLDHNGTPAAGISVSAPASRLTISKATNLGHLLTRTANELSALLGNAAARRHTEKLL